MNASQFILQRESPIFQEYDIDVTPHGEGNRRRRGGFFLGGETSPVKSQTHGGLGHLNRDTEDDLHYVYYVKDKKGQRYTPWIQK